jgi:hypothetical protein
MDAREQRRASIAPPECCAPSPTNDRYRKSSGMFLVCATGKTADGCSRCFANASTTIRKEIDVAAEGSEDRAPSPGAAFAV